MTQKSRVLVYIACSFDGFIAGPGDDLSWLPGADGTTNPEDAPSSSDSALEFNDFMSRVGALLMGRRTYDIVAGFGAPWPYGDKPVLVATNRALDPVVPSVRAVSGDISSLAKLATEAAGDNDVYLDGGNMIRQAMDASIIDELYVTMVPVLLGQGYPLFAGVSRRHNMELVNHSRMGKKMLQVQLRPSLGASLDLD